MLVTTSYVWKNEKKKEKKGERTCVIPKGHPSEEIKILSSLQKILRQSSAELNFVFQVFKNPNSLVPLQKI